MAIRKEYNQSWNPFWLNMPESELPVAGEDQLGGVKVGEGLNIEEDGKLNAEAAPYELPKATRSVLGGVTIGTGLNVNDGKASLATASKYDLGGVKVGSGLKITDGVLSVDGVKGGKWFAGNQNLFQFAIANSAIYPYKNAVYFIPELRATLGRNFELGKVEAGASVSYWDYQRQRSMIVGKILSKSVANETGDGDYIIPTMVIPYDSDAQTGPEIVLRGVKIFVEDGDTAYFNITFDKAYVTNYKMENGAPVELATGFTGAIFNKADGQYQGEYAGNELTKRYMIDITNLVPEVDYNYNISGYQLSFAVRYESIRNKVGHIVGIYSNAQLVEFFQKNAKGAFISCDIGDANKYNNNSEVYMGNLDFTITKPFCAVYADRPV